MRARATAAALTLLAVVLAAPAHGAHQPGIEPEHRFYAVSDPHMASDCGIGCALEPITNGTTKFPRDWKRVIRFKSVVNGARDTDRPLLVAGDLTDHGYDNEWRLYKSILGDRQDGTYHAWTLPPVEVAEGAHQWVYDGTGNHDENRTADDPVGNAYDCIKAWVSVRTPCVGTGERQRRWPVSTCVSYFPWATDQNCPHYSFAYNGLHIVQLNIFPGDTPPGVADDDKRDPLNALTFLVEDLARHAGDGRRVIIVHHYELGNRRWWDQAQEDEYLKALEPYNVAAIIYGHAHGDPRADVHQRNPYEAGSGVLRHFLAGSIVEADDPSVSGLGGAFSEFVISSDSIEHIRYSIHPDTGAWTELSRMSHPMLDLDDPEFTRFAFPNDWIRPPGTNVFHFASDPTVHVDDHDGYEAMARIRTFSRGWGAPAGDWTDVALTRGVCGRGERPSCPWSWDRGAVRDGWYEVEYRARDVVGHVATKTSRFAVDSTPPEISVDYAPRAPNIDGWLRGPTDVTVTVEAGSGTDLRPISCTEPSCPTFTSNGGGTSTGSRLYAADGDHSFVVTAADEAGNQAQKRVDVKIDSKPPTISATRTPPNERGWNAGNVTVAFTCDDDGSGIASCSPADTVSSEGAGQTRQGTASDKAGNAVGITVVDINIDKTPPEIGGSRSPEANRFGWNNTPVDVEFNCDDAVSGIQACQSRLSTSFTCASAGSAPAGPRDCSTSGELHTEGGLQSVSGDARDLAGNRAEAAVGPIGIDLTPPTIAIASPRNGQTYLAGSQLTAEYECNDEPGGSGVAVCEGTAADGERLDTSRPGDRTFTVRATDRADNASRSDVGYRVSCGGRLTGQVLDPLFPLVGTCPVTASR